MTSNDPSERADALAACFEAMALPTAVLDSGQRVMDANAAWRGLMSPVDPYGLTLAASLALMCGEPVEPANGLVLTTAGGGGAYRMTLALAGAHAVAALTDISGDLQALQELRYRYQIRDELLHDAQVGTWRYDPDADVYVFSGELALGHDGIGKPVPTDILRRIQHPDDVAKDAEIRERITHDGGTAVGEMRYRTGDGSWVNLLVHYRAGRRTPSGRYEMYGISQDVTALARVRDEAQAATRTKSEFLASVSHEIRTPMNGVVGVLNLLKLEQLTPSGRDLLGEALACSEMLSQLINDVLDFSKIEAGRLELAATATDPCEVARSVVSLLRPQAEAKGLELRSQCPDGAGHVLIDGLRLRQCLFNVVGNAVKFTQRGHVEVRMSIADRPEARVLRFEVEDTGVGVPQAARDALFGMFQQAETGTTRKFGGTGLGLAISRQLARQMGGDIGFDSVEGQGSTFWLEFAAPAAEAPSHDATDALAGDPLAGVRILVVDDNATNRLVCSRTLEAMGAEAVSVDSGAAALEAVASMPFDLVLMDVNMPEMDGLEATRRIRAMPAPICDLPVVALTADAMSRHEQAYAEAGMNGMAPKPFSPAQLLGAILRLQAEPLDGPAAARAG